MQQPRPRALFQCLAAIGLGVAMGACALEAADDADTTSHTSEIASHQQAITAAALTTAVPWVVRLDLPGGVCTGSVLSEHYILTAGHCVSGYSSNVLSSVSVRWAHVLGGAQALYTGSARIMRNPQYHANDWFGDTGQDVAMLKLDGAGVNLALTGRAKLWGSNAPNINYDPWESSAQNRDFTLIGWGLTDPSGGSTCTSGTIGSKRIGLGFRADVMGRDALEVHAPINATHACGGDSGAPWLFVRGGTHVAFAVHSGRVSDYVVGGDYHRAALTKPKRAWMYQATAFESLKLICAGAGFAGDASMGVTYEECREQYTPPPAPPPGPACPSGKHCCEPVSDTVCGLCIANNRQCP